MNPILSTLSTLYPDPGIDLDWNQDPFKLLIAVMLSAQCTDERVNKVTKVLFNKYPTVRSLADSDESSVIEIIKSLSLFRTKANNIRETALAIDHTFSGIVPQTLTGLLTLPGVARKTANLVLGVAFKIPSGVAVDTHGIRLAQRLGLSMNRDPVKIERDLMLLCPQDKWINLGLSLIQHGRNVCYASKPDCGHCGLKTLCPSV